MERSIDYLLFHFRREIIKPGTISGDANEQPRVKSGLVPRFQEDLPVDDGHLSLHAAELEGAIDQPLQAHLTLRTLNDPGIELEIEVHPVGSKLQRKLSL